MRLHIVFPFLASLAFALGASCLSAQEVDLSGLSESGEAVQPEQNEDTSQEAHEVPEQEEDSTGAPAQEESGLQDNGSVEDMEVPELPLTDEGASIQEEPPQEPEMPAGDDGASEIEEIGEISLPAPGEESKSQWKRWEIDAAGGRMFFSSSANAPDANVYGLMLRYRFSGKGKRETDKVETEIQGRHGIEIRAVNYSADFEYDRTLYSGNDALALVLTVDGKSIRLNTPRLRALAAGSYSYNVVSVNYLYTQVNRKNLTLPKLTSYALIGAGYAFGSDDIGLRMYNPDGTVNPVADPFYTFEFKNAFILHLGGGMRWQLTPRWVLNFEVLDYIQNFDDSEFLRGGIQNNTFSLDNKEVYGHNFFMNFSLGLNF